MLLTMHASRPRHAVTIAQLATVSILSIGLGALIGGCSEEGVSERQVHPESSASHADRVTPVQQPRPVGIDLSAVAEKTAQELESERRRRDETHWANEVLAQEYERFFIRLWDTLRNSPDELSVLAQVPLDAVLVGTSGAMELDDWGVRATRYDGSGTRITSDEWREGLAEFRNKGFRIVQTEWHHSTFEPPGDGPARSVVAMVMDIAGRDGQHRITLKGDLHIEWSREPGPDGIYAPRVVDATGLRRLEREGEPAFKAIMRVEPIPESENESLVISPLIAYDLNGDGLSEILFAGCNTLFWNLGHGRFERDTLFGDGKWMKNAGVVADFTGDGVADFVGVSTDGEGLLYEGDRSGRFRSPGRRSWSFTVDNASALCAGDIDGDGDLDLWLTQYKAPYMGGQMPTPFYDARDGEPAYLLVNDGTGNFVDQTEGSGLVAKRNRRTYSSSFVDLDDDHDLDLIVVSDFAGLDLYTNNGRGHFSDQTTRFVDERHAFGMSHTIGDYNRDGKQDFYMVGMSSTTARRLDRLGLYRAEFPDYARKRAPMTYGNRMYVCRDNRYVQPPMNDHAARTGWSWGSSSFDFDNDGDDDIYVANGHVSGESAQDYCTQYWCHDVYSANSKPNVEFQKYIHEHLRGLNQGRISWNGYEHNVLFMNRGGEAFENVAWLMDVGFEFDSRSVVSDDLDADGRKDLLVLENRWTGPGPNVFRQILHVLRNQLDTQNHWIGVRLREIGPGQSTIGAKVTLHGPFGVREVRIVTGDSYYAQHAPVVHFGLGAVTQVDAVEIRWPNGRVQRIPRPEVDRYHDAAGPTASG